ncbi:hypothetical protein [Mucilaginibacter aquaedulcis]|uniref:hypothetical protein n=1 Tax=Mucilaginibacter aquaedulcis TaxID=1187081 RepID=UPI0025B57F24|nr:hypothetical protein [Mucilaginibacter aquaedulcis]MDN3551174.1 hypothetical protein [Mucilaginibacter aquaedulcis]
MRQRYCNKEIAEAKNVRFEKKMYRLLRTWVKNNPDKALLQFDQSLDEYLANNALRDYFLCTETPLRKLLLNRFVADHLGRTITKVYFDQVTGDPVFSPSEQRLYNLARRMSCEKMHIPFRSIHPLKQTEAGDNADIETYPLESEVRYNSGNHFTSRPANAHVFDENSKQSLAKSEGNLQVMFQRGFLVDRLQDIKHLTASIAHTNETSLQFFVICSRHSIKEGHFGTSLVIMDPKKPDFPQRVLICDTLLKELPQHPRWWNHFIAEYTHVFGDGVAEIIEDISHPLQKVNVKGDDPYNHDWDCPYYALSMTLALADLTKTNPELMAKESTIAIHDAMKTFMRDYYGSNKQIKDRAGIKKANKLKRWNSGRLVFKTFTHEIGSSMHT